MAVFISSLVILNFLNLDSEWKRKPWPLWALLYHSGWVTPAGGNTQVSQPGQMERTVRASCSYSLAAFLSTLLTKKQVLLWELPWYGLGNWFGEVAIGPWRVITLRRQRRVTTAVCFVPFLSSLSVSTASELGGWKSCPWVPAVAGVRVFRFSVLAAVDLKRHQEVLLVIGESRLKMASHGYQNSFLFFLPGFRPMVTFFLLSNDSSLHLLLIPFTLPSITPVVPVPVQMSSMPRNWSTRPLATSWTTPSMTWPLCNYQAAEWGWDPGAWVRVRLRRVCLGFVLESAASTHLQTNVGAGYPFGRTWGDF